MIENLVRFEHLSHRQSSRDVAKTKDVLSRLASLLLRPGPSTWSQTKLFTYNNIKSFTHYNDDIAPNMAGNTSTNPFIIDTDLDKWEDLLYTKFMEYHGIGQLCSQKYRVVRDYETFHEKKMMYCTRPNCKWSKLIK